MNDEFLRLRTTRFVSRSLSVILDGHCAVG